MSEVSSDQRIKRVACYLLCRWARGKRGGTAVPREGRGTFVTTARGQEMGPESIMLVTNVAPGFHATVLDLFMYARFAYVRLDIAG